MKTVPIYLLALFVLSRTEEETTPRKRRGSFQTSFPIGNNLQIGGVDVDTYSKTSFDIQDDLRIFSPELGEYLNLPQFPHLELSTRADLPDFPGHPAFPPQSGTIDKPVGERQEYIPPQASGQAIIPNLPPAAIPVNVQAANVPAVGNSVFLGSGSIGVLDLGGGAYVLGSGALGYSERRSNPRMSYRSPLLPPVIAAPNLIPAAVSSPEPAPVPIYDLQGAAGTKLPVDENGYEYFPPERAGFGDPIPTRPLKITMTFATPTALQIPTQFSGVPLQIPTTAAGLSRIQISGLTPQIEISSLSPQQAIYGQKISGPYPMKYFR